MKQHVHEKYSVPLLPGQEDRITAQMGSAYSYISSILLLIFFHLLLTKPWAAVRQSGPRSTPASMGQPLEASGTFL